MADLTPRPEHKFSFGLWTVGNRGRDPFGEPVRDALPPVDAVKLLADAGAWGVNLHDNDLVPIDATPAERDRSSRSSSRPEGQRAGRADGDDQPVRRSGLQGRRLHRQRSAGARLCCPEDHARDRSRRGAGGEDLCLLGRPRGHGDRRCRRADEPQALPRGAELAVRVLDRPEIRLPFALEAKPNEPRGDIYLATTGNYLALFRRWITPRWSA